MLLKGSETLLAEEYCWAITQAAGRSCNGRSGSFGSLECNWVPLCVLVPWTTCVLHAD
jgi:hypothetical protein